MTETIQESPFLIAYKGRFSSILRWHQLDQFWQTFKALIKDDQWYIYAVGQGVPHKTVSQEKLLHFIEEIDQLLRKDHTEDYCGIVYVDDKENPSFIKIFDPNNLGVSCGYSDNPPAPGWILSKLTPVDLQSKELITGSRKRWWKKFF